MTSELFNSASVIFFVVYGLIVFRNLRRINLPLWAIMFAGAVAMIFLNGISIREAYAAINLDVIFFLIGMFSIVSGLEASGLLRYFTIQILSFAGSPQKVLFFILAAFGNHVGILDERYYSCRGYSDHHRACQGDEGQTCTISDHSGIRCQHRERDDSHGKSSSHTFSFYEFFKIGSIVTLVNIVILSSWLILLSSFKG